MTYLKRAVFVILFLLVASVSLAQEATCPAIVETALEAVENLCSGIGRNEACYGNLALTAAARDGVADFQFDQPGDIVSVTDIASLTLSGMDVTANTWGIALMQLQANLPETLPGQNVTVLIFGDVQMTNTVTIVLTELPVTTTANVNVRLRPTTTGNTVISSLTRGQVVTANGRLADNSWVRVVLDAETQVIGWVSADFVSSENGLERLTVVDEADTSQYRPMQAFYFTSGIGDSPCAEVPDSGILIQTPAGAGTIELTVNDVYITLGSTVYMQAGAGVMTVSVLEGHAVLTVGDISQTVPAGTYAQIPLDTNGVADGTPTYPQSYTNSSLGGLPRVVAVVLPQEIELASPISGENDIDAAIAIAEGLPPSGIWLLTRVGTQPNCSEATTDVGSSHSYNISITFNEDHSMMHVVAGLLDGAFTRTSDSRYQWSGDGDIWVITFTSPTTFVGNFAQGDLADPCIYHTNDSGAFVG